MSNIVKFVEVNIELEEEEKDVLLKAYKILNDIAQEMWSDGMDEADELWKAVDARDGLKTFLSCVGVKV